jgi:hypothetical protein
MKRNHHDACTTDRGVASKPSMAWRLAEAMAYAGAYIDPTGMLAVERLRRIREGEE